MKHPPIETWYCGRTRTEIQPTDLNRHFSTCSWCRETYHAWKEVEMALVHSPLKAPEPGFVSRWESYALLRSRQSHQTLWKWSVGLILFALLVLASAMSLAIISLNTNLTAEMISSLIRVLSHLPNTWLQLRYAATFWLREIPPYWLAAFNFFLYLWTILPLSTWLYALVKYTFRGVKPT